MQLYECITAWAIATAVRRPTISLQVQSVLIMFSAHRVCVLWNSSFYRLFELETACKEIEKTFKKKMMINSDF